MKATVRIPTEQYGYIELEDEVVEIADAVELHNSASKEYWNSKKEKPGVPELEFSKIVDRYMTDGGSMLSAEYENLNPFQEYTIQCLKKFKKRAANKK